MRIAILCSAGSCIIATALGATATAQTSPSLTEHQRAREEYKLAEAQVERQQGVNDTFQRELNDLMEQKVIWGRAVLDAKNDLAKANGQLERYQRAGSPAEIEKWKRQVADSDGRLKAAVIELEKVEVDIRDKVQAMRNWLRASAESSVLVPGDAIEVFVTEDETLNGVYQVREGGYIILPRVGRIMILGKDLAGAEQAIRESLAVSQIKDATVMVERPTTGGPGGGAGIYLAGEFIKPGKWLVPPGTTPTIVTAILGSGGLRPDADLTRVRLLRLVAGQAQVEEVNVQAIMHGAGLASDLALKPGDIVFVPAFANVVYVTGNVLRPASLKLLPDEELTAYSAILRCGGFARFANRKKVYVLREMGDGAKQKIPVNIHDVQAGRAADVILKSKDIVVVPERFFSF